MKFKLNRVLTIHSKPRKFLKAQSVKFKTKHQGIEDELSSNISPLFEIKTKIPPISKIKRFKENSHKDLLY